MRRRRRADGRFEPHRDFTFHPDVKEGVEFEFTDAMANRGIENRAGARMRHSEKVLHDLRGAADFCACYIAVAVRRQRFVHGILNRHAVGRVGRLAFRGQVADGRGGRQAAFHDVCGGGFQ